MRRGMCRLAHASTVLCLQSSCVAHVSGPVGIDTLDPHATIAIFGTVRPNGSRIEYLSSAPAQLRQGRICAMEGWEVQTHTLRLDQIRGDRRFANDPPPGRIMTVDGQQFMPSRIVDVTKRSVIFETRTPIPIVEANVPMSDVRTRWLARGELVSIQLRSGYVGSARLLEEAEDALLLRLESCAPLSEFREVVLRKVDHARTAERTLAAVLVTPLVFLGLLSIAVWLTWP